MKHNEQIALVVLGYVIGFVTAFISFELVDQNDPVLDAPRESHEYGLVATVHGDEGNVIADSTVDNKGLFVSIGGRDRIVSAAALTSEGDSTGYHYAVPQVLVSPDRQLLYYCAQLDADDTDCYSFVYRVADDSVYVVREGDQQHTVQIGVDAVSWTSDNRLSSGAVASVSSEAPWELE